MSGTLITEDFQRVDDGEIQRFVYQGETFSYRRIHVTDRTCLGWKENAARKRKLSAVPYYPTDYHAMKVFACERPGLQKNLERYRQRLVKNTEARFTKFIDQGHTAADIKSIRDDLIADGWPLEVS